MTTLSFSRRVSFSNVNPEDEPGPRFNEYPLEPLPQPTDWEHRFFGNYTYGRKRPKLPDPPSKSILKNKLTWQQLHDNLSHALLTGVSYHGDLNDMALRPPELVPRSELVSLVDDENCEELPSPPKMPLQGPRRKSYSEMSDQELMELDPQFSKSQSSDLNSFNFNPLLNYYGPLPKKPTSSNASLLVQSLAKATVYPLSNENNYPSILLTVKHKDYGRNLLTTRKILTVVSGRKHSWNSLDWLLHNKDCDISSVNPPFLQDGDYLIVAALVPLTYFNAASSRKRASLEDHLHRKCERMLNYILESLPNPDVRATITVEFILDTPPADPMSLNGKKPPPVGTKLMLYNLFSQYLPNLVIIGNKYSNLNFKYPMRRKRNSSTQSNPWNTRLSLPTRDRPDNDFELYLIRLSSYIVKYSPVPVIIVGSLMVDRHSHPHKPSLVTFKDTLRIPLDFNRKNSAALCTSIESFAGQQPDAASAVSSSSENLTAERATRFDEWMANPSETMFQDMATSISLSSLSQLKKYLDMINGDPDKVPPELYHSKVHHTFQSTAKGVLPTKTCSNGSNLAYRVKSLISYDEAEEKKNEKKINDKKLKATASRSPSMSSLDTSKEGSGDEKKKKKRSFLQKIGLKK